MPIPFRCPHCGRPTQVDDQYAGQTGPCAGCGKTITIPGTASSVAHSAKKSSTAGIVLAVAGAFLAIVVCGGVLTFSFWTVPPGINLSHEAAGRSRCATNLKQIGIAFHNYHDVYRTFPPAYIPDADGKPMHSWRVLILPFLEEQALYDQYDFNEPWNGPNNSRLVASMPDVYQCPDFAIHSGGFRSCYAMIVGPGTISDGPTAHRIADIKDGTSNTLMVVETLPTSGTWLEPHDLDAQEMSFQVNDHTAAEGIKSDHPGGANALFSDGAVHFMANSTPATVLKALSTIAGGETVGEF